MKNIYHSFVDFLSYDSIALIPAFVSTLEHRAEADTSVRFGPFNLKVPILAAPMQDVCGGKMANALASVGALGVVHRFGENYSIKEYNQIKPGTPVACAVSFKDLEQVSILWNWDYRVFCIDTANGASEMVERAVKTLKDKYNEIFIIAGNVATPETFSALQEWGVDAIRVGIAGGSVCETRTETGVYSPMATTVYACNLAKTTSLLIADGGIKTPGDMCKALALGADVVMMGGALAGTKEAPGPIILYNGKKYKRMAGAASYVSQKDQNKDPQYVEGSETLVEYKGSVIDVIDRFKKGLQSSMSYMDARDIVQYKSNVRIINV